MTYAQILKVKILRNEMTVQDAIDWICEYGRVTPDAADRLLGYPDRWFK